MNNIMKILHNSTLSFSSSIQLVLTSKLIFLPIYEVFLNVYILFVENNQNTFEAFKLCFFMTKKVYLDPQKRI
jgi:hypothetical protein